MKINLNLRMLQGILAAALGIGFFQNCQPTSFAPAPAQVEDATSTDPVIQPPAPEPAPGGPGTSPTVNGICGQSNYHPPYWCTASGTIENSVAFMGTALGPYLDLKQTDYWAFLEIARSACVSWCDQMKMKYPSRVTECNFGAYSGDQLSWDPKYRCLSRTDTNKCGCSWPL